MPTMTAPALARCHGTSSGRTVKECSSSYRRKHSGPRWPRLRGCWRHLVDWAFYRFVSESSSSSSCRGNEATKELRLTVDRSCLCASELHLFSAHYIAGTPASRISRSGRKKFEGCWCWEDLEDWWEYTGIIVRFTFPFPFPNSNSVSTPVHRRLNLLH